MLEFFKEIGNYETASSVVASLPALLGVILGSIFSILPDYLKRRRFRPYNTMLLASTLQQLIYDCRAVAMDELEDGQNGEIFTTAPLPKLDWAVALDWTEVRKDLMYKCLGIRPAMKSAGEIIDFYRDLAGPPDYSEYFTAIKVEYSKIGLLAVPIYNEICKDYGIKVDNGKIASAESEFKKFAERY